MALTLNSTLNTAQNGTTHKPILKLLSSDWAGEIPFDGTVMRASTLDEYGPASIVHGSNRILTMYYDQDGYIIYYYTDVDRVTWSYVLLNPPDLTQNISLVELTNGDIGAVYRDSANRVKRFIITVTGQIVSTWTTIFDETDGLFMSGPFLFTTAAGDYMMVYAKYVTGDTHYHFFTRTSSNFTSWGAETEISIGVLDPLKKVADPMVLRITTGNLLLFFSYLEQEGEDAEKWNIYYSISTDNGATWGNAIKITNYTTYNAIGVEPYAAQKQANELILTFTERRPSLVISESALGWHDCGDAYISGFHFDPVDRMLYANLGSRGMVMIDADTWEVVNCWDKNTTPGVSLCWDTYWGGSANSFVGDGPYFGFLHSAMCTICMVNGKDNWIREYYFEDTGYPDPCQYIKNVAGFTPYYTPNLTVRDVFVDESENKVWVVLSSFTGAVWAPQTQHIGYFELSDTGPTFTWHEVFLIKDWHDMVGTTTTNPVFYFFPDQNLFFAHHPGGFWAGYSHLFVYDLTTGGMLKHWHYSTHPDFPAYAGNVAGSSGRGWAYDPAAGKIYCTLEYTTELDQGDRRGIAIIDYITERTVYDRPTYATYNDYMWNGISLNNAGEVLLSINDQRGGGIAIFDPSTYVWTYFQNSTYPGLFPNSQGTKYNPIYDEQENIIYTATFSEQIVAFNRFGYIKLAKYKMGTYTTSWAFGDTESLVQGFIDYDPAVVYDAVDGGLYTFWVNQTGTEWSIKWDKEISNFNLADYILAGSEVVVTRSIDGNPATLDFAIAKGHLFDSFNTASLLRTVLSKGRKIVVQQGEKISGTEYWQNLGTFVVMERNLTYKRGEYPAMSVRAECRSGIWREHIIPSTSAYSNYPEDIIKDVVTDFTDMLLADISLPTFVDRTTIYHSWVDTSVWDIVMQLCHRYCYYPRLDVDGKLTARLISNANTVNHTYADSAKIIDLTPDDSFSDYTNRVVVSGQERDYSDILYDEERVGFLSGTVGWWAGGKSYTVYYSEDKEKRVLNPRLDVIDTATSIIGELAGEVSEGISYTDPEHHYLIIDVDTTNLTGPLSALIMTTIIGTAMSPDAASAGDPHWHHRVGTWLTDASILAALMILSSATTFQYEIYGQPIGEVRRSVQCYPVPEDLAMQEIYGMVVEKKIDDPLCYTVEDCNKVAEFELLIVQLQRKRVKFSKVTHLQDEEGDTIKIVHPYSGGTMTVFITDLVRKMMVPATPDSEGYWIDEIEGWVIDQ